MDYFKLKPLIFAVALAALSSASHAGYAMLNPPPGWVSSKTPLIGAPTGADLRASYAAAANEQWINNTVRTNASLNVGGKAVTVPAHMRMASNAPKFVAGRLGAGLAAGLLSPIGIGLTVLAVLSMPEVQDWIKETVIYRWNPQTQQFEKKISSSGGECQVGANGAVATAMTCSAAAAIVAAALSEPGREYTVGSCSPGPTSCIFKVKFTDWLGNVSESELEGSAELKGSPSEETWTPADYEKEVKPALETVPIPEVLPQKLPIPWPVEDPVINPSLDPVPQPQPLTVPTGAPVPVPNTDPQQYTRPGIKVVPSPTPESPWQVDVQPVDIPTDAQGEPLKNPDGTPKAETPATPDLCAAHPEILACQTLGDPPEVPDLETKDVSLVITPDSGWGSEGGACPAPRAMSHAEFSFQPYCDYASGLRPVIVAVAWLTAAFIVVGASKGGN